MVWLVLVFSMVAGATPYKMNDVGGTLDLPDYWEGKSYSDTDLTAERKDKRGKLMFRMWMTDYQVPLSEAAGKAFADDYAVRLGSLGGRSVAVESQQVRSLGGRDTLWTIQTFESKKGAKLLAQTAAIVGHGNVIHMRIWSNAKQRVSMKNALYDLIARFKLTKEPGAVVGGPLTAEDGFSATLPDGWRTPIGKEQDRVDAITGKLWASKKGTTPCWVAIRPIAIGNPDVMFSCGRPWQGGPIDEHSMASVDEEMRTLFFRGAAAEVPPAEKVTIGDRMGLMYKPRSGVNALRLAIAPYDKGLITIWAQAGSLSEDALDLAIAGVAGRTTFTGPDGGKQIIRADKMVGYYLAHRTTSPVVLGPIVVVVGVVIFFVMRRRKSSAEEWDDVTEM